MASQTYTTRALVLKKTKLGESDVIFTLLGQDGSQVRAVAKGARKPTSQFSSRLELYSVVDLLVNKGRNLDIITEARLIESGDKLRTDICYSTAAAPMAELLERTTQRELAVPKLFELTQVALAALNATEVEKAPAMTAAHLLKALAFLGIRPSLDVCVKCGSPLDLTSGGDMIGLSFDQGGILCGDCGSMGSVQMFSVEVIRWMIALLSLKFEDIEQSAIDISTAFEILHFCQAWVQQHVGARLKSLDFMFTSGIYE